METREEVAIDRQSTFYLEYGKRILDVLGALAGLMITSPILGLCAIAIHLESPGPIIFRQWRVGQAGDPFQILKLRTMVQHADRQGPKLTGSGDARITRVGKWLRKTKLDEIPQLLNVLRGEMSLVGPRPELPEYVVTYSRQQRKLLEFKPGMTGPASLAFIDEERLLARHPDIESFYVGTILARKLELDLAYCQMASLVGDFKLLFRTILRLFDSTRENRGHTQA
ncbi:MAG: sugar transferase [Terriglobia bacterium]|jgi:lipopolysaccharide/colanic/teichoic acid biosynthesis glycosyltransferase